jgi:malate synthase
MTTRPKRKKKAAVAKKSARKSAKKSAKKAAAKKKAIARTRGAKPARRRKVRTPKKTARPGASSKAAAKAPKRFTRRRLASSGASGRRIKVIAVRGPARGRVSPRRSIAKSAARAPHVAGVAIKGAMGSRYAEVLTPAALRFLADLHRELEAPRNRALASDDAGGSPDFRPGTIVRDDADPGVAQLVADLQHRRIPIVAPADRKMLLHALNSGIEILVADFANANAPTWGGSIEGQINLKDRWSGKLSSSPARRKRERISDKPTLIVRPRGWRLAEQHVTVDGAPVSAALFDFGLCFFHNARAQVAAGAAAHFYLPKLETHEEARLWNDAFAFALERLGLAVGTIRALIQIENRQIENRWIEDPQADTPAFELIV